MAQSANQSQAAAAAAQPTEKKRGKYFTKTTKFGSKEMTLYSLDGVTWSSRRDELSVIQERHEAERQKLLANMGEVKAEEERETAKDSGSTKESSDEGAPLIMDDAEVAIDDEGDEKKSAKASARSNRPIKDLPARPEAKASAKGNPKASKKKQVHVRDRVQFVAPKPRQIEKARKAAKAKKKKAA